jgi:hypothetical protein
VRRITVTPFLAGDQALFAAAGPSAQLAFHALRHQVIDGIATAQARNVS